MIQSIIAFAIPAAITLISFLALRHLRFFMRAERVAGVIIEPMRNEQAEQDLSAKIAFWTKDCEYFTLPVTKKDTKADLTKKSDVIILYDPKDPQKMKVKKHPHGGR